MLFIKGKKKSFQQWLKPKMILFGSWNVSKIAIKATVGFYCERQEKEEAYFSPCPIWWSKSSNWCSIYMWRYVTNCVLHPDTLTHTHTHRKPTYRDSVGSVREPALNLNWSSSDLSFSISSASCDWTKQFLYIIVCDITCPKNEMIILPLYTTSHTSDMAAACGADYIYRSE